MSTSYDFLGIKASFESPLMPYAGHSLGRVNENSVHVKQQGIAEDFSHLTFIVMHIPRCKSETNE